MNSIKRILFVFTISVFLCFSNTLAQSQIDSLTAELELKVGKDRLDILIQLGFLENYNNPTKGLEYCEEAIIIAKTINDKIKEARAISNMGVCYWSLNKYEEALEKNRAARKIYENLNDSLRIATTLSNDGIIYDIMGKPDIALEKYLQALKIANAEEDYSFQSRILMNIGIVYQTMQNNEKGLEYYLEAERISIKAGNVYGILLSNISQTYVDMKEYKIAEKYLARAIPQLEREGDTRGLGSANQILGLAAENQGNNVEAFKYYFKSLEFQALADNKNGIVQSNNALGTLYNKVKNYKNAEKHLRQALIISKEINSIPDLITSYKELSATYSGMSNYKKALDYYRLYGDSTKSFYNKESSTKIAELQTQYESKEKAKENELLKKENDLQKETIQSQQIIAIATGLVLILTVVLIVVLLKNRKKELKAKKILIEKNDKIKKHEREISKQNDTLAELNATKDRYFSVIAHDLKNPLGVVTNFSELLESDYDKYSEKEKRAIVGHINTSISNVNYLLDNLLTWASVSSNKISIDKQKVSLKEIIESSIKPFEQFGNNKQISIIKNIPETLEFETDKFMLQTIVGNITNNAIKFSKQSGKVVISCDKLHNFIQISIEDFGVGMDETTIKNLFNLKQKKSSVGTNGEKGTGLGLILVQEFVKQLEGTLNIESTLNEGTNFIIQIPTN